MPLRSLTSSDTPAPLPTVRWRLVAAGIAAAVAAVFVTLLYARQQPGAISDWDPTFAATRALIQGRNPYAEIRVPPWPNYLLYPLPALLVTAPFTVLPHTVAQALFTALGTAAFTYAVTRQGVWRLYLVLSGAMLWSWVTVQWAPLLIAGALLPALSWVFAVKPTVGFALWAAWPSRRAVVLGLILVGISFAVRPGWVPEWLEAVSHTPHKPNILRPGGFLLLLGLLRWRRPEGRLLACLALIPQTTALYEVLPVGLVADRKHEAMAFAVLTMVGHLLFFLGPQGAWPIGAGYQWWVLLILVYLPFIAIVLRRPNVAPDAGAP